MGQKTIQLDQFQVIGISVRTTNQNGQSQKDIGNLFGRFMMENLIEKIPNKENNDIYCIYTDYESDQTAPYTTIIGCRVSSLQSIPEGFISKVIPKTTYQIYTSKGKLPDCVGETWMKIWNENSPNRKYIADFDVYGSKSQNPTEAEVDTYLSIR
ncbi:MAG: AraC family transcriptional regulator [Pedobacter sp.]|nr:MAG: AraC family transcriptional regulator [Pedobacter sp.]